MIRVSVLLLVIGLLFGTAVADTVTPSERVILRLNVRQAAQMDAPIVGHLLPGEQARLLGVVPYWYRVELPGGVQGFVSKAWSVRIADSIATQPLRLGAWNIKKLGHNNGKDYALVASIIDRHFDVVALIEVMQKTHTHPGYDRLVSELGPGWRGMVTQTPRPDTGAGYAEYYAFLYRPSRVEPCETPPRLEYVPDNDGGPAGTGEDRFSREPAYTCFLVRNASGGIGVDFVIAGYHATWKKEHGIQDIRNEVAHLPVVFQTMMAAYPGEGDLFVIGDFNLVPGALAQVQPFIDQTEGSGSTLRPGGSRTTNLYDHLVVHDPAVSGELQGNARVLVPQAWQTDPDRYFHTVSDHLPIRVLVETNGTDDD
jgi:hypothetical protein